MKQKNIRMTFAGIVFASLALLMGCNKTQKDETCTISKPTKIVNITTAAKTNPFSVWVGAFRNDPDKSYSFARSNKSSSNSELIEILAELKIINIPNVDYSKIISVILFIDKSLVQDNQMLAQNVKAVLIYNKSSKDQLNTTLLAKNSSSFQLVKEMTATTNAISSNDIYTIGRYYKTSISAPLTSVEYVSMTQLYERKGKENMHLKLYNFINSSKVLGASTLSRLDSAGKVAPIDSKCAEPCYSLDGTCNQYILDAICEKKPKSGGGICPRNVSMDKTASTTSSQSSQYDNVLQSFKNDYLTTTLYGQHQIQNFYYLGDDILANLSLNDATEAVNLTNTRIIPIINKLLNNPASDNSILYDDQVKNEIQLFINKIKLLSTDQTFLDILHQVENDLQSEVNKSVSQVHNDIINY